MSASSQPGESVNWKPSISEITDLLSSLGISPPQTPIENFSTSSPISWRNSTSLEFDREDTEISDCVSESDITLNENFDRVRTIEELQIARENGKNIRRRNNYFHDYLVEHFKRKQMMHVYTDESEEDVLLNEYLRKLDELERSNEELRKTHEEWDAELTRTQANIRGKREEAKQAVDAMIENERSVGSSTWSCGKPLGIKRIQNLITRQLDRIKDIAKFRLRYTRLRDEFIARELELRRIEISSPNLTKEDYERLEAEQFYYNRELTTLEKECENFRERHDCLVRRIDAIRRTIVDVTREICECKRALGNLRDRLRTNFENKNICREKVANAKDFVRRFDETVRQTERSEFAARRSNVNKEHEEWMRKISRFLRDIKNLGQSLNAVRANLMLHGKHLEGRTVGNDTSEKSVEHSVN